IEQLLSPLPSSANIRFFCQLLFFSIFFFLFSERLPSLRPSSHHRVVCLFLFSSSPFLFSSRTTSCSSFFFPPSYILFVFSFILKFYQWEKASSRAQWYPWD